MRAEFWRQALYLAWTLEDIARWLSRWTRARYLKADPSHPLANAD